MATFALSLVSSCKTTENNYRQAYERTMAQNDSTRNDFDQTIYGRHRREMRSTPVSVNGDTLDARVMLVKITEDGGGMQESLKPYLIVVGEFKQLFNAKSMRERLLDKGFPGAFLVETGEPFYYVIATTASTPDEALRIINTITAKPPFRLRDGVPFALRPPQFIK